LELDAGHAAVSTPRGHCFSPCEKREAADGESLDKEKTLVEIAAMTGHVP